MYFRIKQIWYKNCISDLSIVPFILWTPNAVSYTYIFKLYIFPIPTLAGKATRIFIKSSIQYILSLTYNISNKRWFLNQWLPRNNERSSLSSFPKSHNRMRGKNVSVENLMHLTLSPFCFVFITCLHYISLVLLSFIIHLTYRIYLFKYPLSSSMGSQRNLQPYSLLLHFIFTTTMWRSLDWKRIPDPKVIQWDSMPYPSVTH